MDDVTRSFVGAPLAPKPIAAGPPSAGHPLGTDPFTDPRSQHATEVEPDSFAVGDTIVAAFQVGRFRDGGSNDIGVATTTDAGKTWTSSMLPGITVAAGGKFERVSDPAVAFNAKFGVWQVSSLAISSQGGTPVGAAVVINRSKDGITWEKATPVVTGSAGSFLDKNWTVCDNNPNSPFFGNTYTVFDDNGQGDLVQLTTSSDGGLTWTQPQATPDQFTGLGGEPLVQPDGTVIIPMCDASEGTMWSVVSRDGGKSWSSANPISDIQSHGNSAGLRTGPLPSASIDASGKVYMVWQDSRFEGGSANDMVMSTSTDGVTWTSPVRIPIDAVGSNVDHFIPGLAVDPTTSGDTAHMALSYYFYPKADCGKASCDLSVGMVSSLDGGKTWSAPTVLAGPMKVAWLPQTTQGSMVGDYMTTTFDSKGKAHPVFALARPAVGGKLDVSMMSPPGGIALAAGTRPVEAAAPGMFSLPTTFAKGTPGDFDL